MSAFELLQACFVRMPARGKFSKGERSLLGHSFFSWQQRDLLFFMSLAVANLRACSEYAWVKKVQKGPTKSCRVIGMSVQLPHAHRRSFSWAESNRKLLVVSSASRFSSFSIRLTTSCALCANLKFAEGFKRRLVWNIKAQMVEPTKSPSSLFLPGFVILFALMPTQSFEVQHPSALVRALDIPTYLADKKAGTSLLWSQSIHS